MNRRDLLCFMGASAAGLAVSDGRAAAGAATPGSLDTFLSTFHVDKRDPRQQVETDHYGVQLSADVFQSVVFHGPSRKLVGVEYIITDRLYRSLPLEEKALWHPHSHDVLAGLLAAPGTPPEREADLVRDLVTCWGKAWLTWPDPTTALPEGVPALMWSVTCDGQLGPALRDARDARLGVSTQANRADRQAFGRPVPQVGPPESVDELGRQWR